MNPTAPTDPPIARSEQPNHIQVPGGDGPTLSREFWPSVDAEIQAELAALDGQIRREIPTVRIVAGRTCGAVFYLCSYRTFSLPDTDIDPVVVSLTFAPAQAGVAVEAAVSGEHHGEIIAELPSVSVPGSRDEVLAAARAAARQLRALATPIVAALRNESRRPD